MEDMWKTRKPPEALKFDQVLEEASHGDLSATSTDQKPWTLAENFAVFSDRYNNHNRMVGRWI